MYLEKQILFIFFMPAWIIIRIIIFHLNKTKFSLKREIALNIFFIYILCLLSVTLFPLKIDFAEHDTWVSVNLIPVIKTVKDVSNSANMANMHDFMIRFWIKNIVGNILLLFPLGVMMPILWRKFNSLTKTVFFAFCLSLSIEALQLFSVYIGNRGRAFDIDDIILNTIGAFIGFALYNGFLRVKENLKLSMEDID